MALFRVSHGPSGNLPSYHEGYCYFTTDDGRFHIDTTVKKNGADQQVRLMINPHAIVGLSVSGKVITYTKNDGTTGTINTQDTNTTYSAGTGISLSGTTFSNSGVRSIATGTANGTISVNTNGTVANVAVKGLGSLAYSSATYAGGTAVTLNGASKAGSTASFFAPTTAGTSGQFLKSNGSGAPTWTSISVAGLTHIGTSQPTSSDYVLWVDTDEEALPMISKTEAEQMNAATQNLIKNHLKYKTFSIGTGNWSGSGPYTYTMTATGITANSAILNLTLDATSQTRQKAQLDWETKSNKIVLSTATKPTGTISGYLIAADVVVI